MTSTQTVAQNSIGSAKAYHIGDGYYWNGSANIKGRYHMQVEVTGWSAPLDFHGRYAFTAKLFREGHLLRSIMLQSGITTQNDAPPYGTITYAAISFMLSEQDEKKQIPELADAVIPIGDTGCYSIDETFLIPPDWHRHGFHHEQVWIGAQTYRGQDTDMLILRQTRLGQRADAIQQQIDELREKLRELDKSQPYLEVEIWRRKELEDNEWQDGAK